MLTNPALWMVDSEAVGDAAPARLDPEGTSTVAQGVDRAFDLRPEPPPAGARRLTYTVDEAAELLGISRALAYQAEWLGEIPPLRICRRTLVLESAFECLVARASDGEDATALGPPE